MVETTTGIYTVEKGDSLYSIAKKLGVPNWRFIWGNNWKELGLNPSLIQPGQKLLIPDVTLMNAA